MSGADEAVVMLFTAPMQAWGGPATSHYRRPTEPMPTLSAVVGLIANAMGRTRTDPIDDLADGAGFAVRADRPGRVRDDFHTVGTPGRYAAAAGTGKQLRHPVVTVRSYLEDAAFVAVYTPPAGGAPAQEVLAALKNPARILYLGRVGCMPSARVGVAVVDGSDPMEVLTTAPLLRRPPRRWRPEPDTGGDDAIDYFDAASAQHGAAPGSSPSVEVRFEATAADGQAATSTRKDAPIYTGFNRFHHGDRHVVAATVPVPASLCAGTDVEAVQQLYEALGAAP